MSPLETPEKMAERLMWAEDILDPSTVRLRAIREDRRVIAGAMEREAVAADCLTSTSQPDREMRAYHQGQHDALRDFARALRGEP